MTFTTADLCDAHSEDNHFQIAEPLLKSYGGRSRFCGQITTVKVFEDNVLIRSVLEHKVENRVLVVDGGGSHRCALLGADLAKLAIANGWQGVVIHGCIRDSEIIDQLPIGIRALHTHPLKSHKKDHGDRELVVTFAGVNFKQNHFLYADGDGIIVSETMLS
ncbi:ribonuclease E activity regulator RraA [Candidatus Methylobacter oryzae]|uniref:4-hydroxy-4-methyl-2-oxoglutarate aldolase n=1 Tax=Candidatus Methylobacter oryzae TaxID=2497749 RepID=A0ABY3CD80_9GAMM|nr:ribonuclease E activity regulator RraA [Candidatus Methylobacter oryzae]TRX00529.1 RraA family protein [Candidatus Methylobacter oryzae]